jgi:hypothetical protein
MLTVFFPAVCGPSLFDIFGDAGEDMSTECPLDCFSSGLKTQVGRFWFLIRAGAHVLLMR